MFCGSAQDQPVYSEELALRGLPALRSCHIRFHTGSDSHGAVLLVNHLSFYEQRSSLQTLTLRGVNSNIRMPCSAASFGMMPTLRNLSIQNLGLTGLQWLPLVSSSPALASLRTLQVDDNKDLQLDGAATAALLAMTALTKLSIRRSPLRDKRMATAATQTMQRRERLLGQRRACAASRGWRLPGPISSCAFRPCWPQLVATWLWSDHDILKSHRHTA